MTENVNDPLYATVFVYDDHRYVTVPIKVISSFKVKNFKPAEKKYKFNWNNRSVEGIVLAIGATEEEANEKLKISQKKRKLIPTKKVVPSASENSQTEEEPNVKETNIRKNKSPYTVDNIKKDLERRLLESAKENALPSIGKKQNATDSARKTKNVQKSLHPCKNQRTSNNKDFSSVVQTNVIPTPLCKSLPTTSTDTVILRKECQSNIRIDKLLETRKGTYPKKDALEMEIITVNQLANERKDEWMDIESFNENADPLEVVNIINSFGNTNENDLNIHINTDQATMKVNNSSCISMKSASELTHISDKIESSASKIFSPEDNTVKENNNEEERVSFRSSVKEVMDRCLGHRKEIEKLKNNLKEMVMCKSKQQTIIHEKEKEIKKLNEELNRIRLLNYNHQDVTMNGFQEFRDLLIERNRQINISDASSDVPVGRRSLDRKRMHMGRGVYIDIIDYCQIISSSKTISAFPKLLAKHLFGLETLLKSTITGRPSHRTKSVEDEEEKEVQKLDVKKLLAIQDTYSYWMQADNGYERDAADMEATNTMTYLSQYIGNIKSKKKPRNNAKGGQLLGQVVQEDSTGLETNNSNEDSRDSGILEN